MAATKCWRSGALFHGVACLGTFVVLFTGCGSEIGTDPANVVDDDRGTLGSNVSNFRIEASADPNDPASHTFRVVDEDGSLVDDYALSWDFGDGQRHLEHEETFAFAGAGQFSVSVTGSGPGGEVAFSLSLEVNVAAAPDAPLADAGLDQTVDENAIVYLFGGNTVNPRGLELSYSWSQLDGPDVMILDAETMTASFVAPLVDATTVVSFELIVSDGEYMTSDLVSVAVNDLGGETISVQTAAVYVTASAGADQQVYGATTVTLDGSRSSGPTGTTPTFRWRQLSGPTVTLQNSTRPVASFVAPLATTANVALSFRLTVTAGSGRSNDTIAVTVLPNDPCLADSDGDGIDNCGDDCPNDPSKSSPGICGCGVADADSDADGTPDCLDTGDPTEEPPPADPLVASAGADSSIQVSGSALLIGSASGGVPPYTYQWSPTTGLSSATVASPTASPASTTTYTLTITDSQAQTATDSMVVTVQTAALVANAGADRSITAGASTSLTGSGSGGTAPYAYRWTPTTGLNNPSVASPTAAPTATTTYTLTVTDAASRTASDSVVVTVTQPAPALSASVQSLSFGSASTSMTFEVWNSGGQTLSYTLSDNAAWLSVSPTSGTSTGEHDTITATVNRGGLADGNYNGVITVTPTTGAAWTIAVAMSVSTAPGGSMTAANRTSGPAPLAVVFDAVRSDSGVAAPLLSGSRRDYASYNYSWNFSDGASGTWTHSGKSKNEATGFVAAHVFDTPGSYRVTLAVTDTAGSVRSYEQTITVQDPEVIFANSSADTAERTLYVAANGSDTNNGSLNRPLQTWARAKTLLFASNGPRRVLLRRGDSFAHNTTGTITGRTGPFQVAAYGTGANPVINSPSATNELLALDATATDVRVVDVDMYGNTAGACIRPGTNTLIHRCKLINFSNGVTTSDAHGLKDGVVLSENTIQNNDRYGVYFNFGQRVAILGNLIDDVNGEHLVRSYITHSLVQHNIFRNGHPAKHQLKFCGYFPTGSVERAVGTPTETVEFSIISDNTFEQAGPINWMITLGPVDNTKNQHTQDVVFERNVLRADPDTQVMLYANNNYITVRNNVFDGTLKPGVTAIRVTRRGVEPPPTGYNIFNNTCYSGASSGGITCAQIDSMASNTTVRNNFAVASTGGLMIGNGGTGLVQSNNVLVSSGGFVNAAAGDFRLTAGSAAIDAGMVLPHVIEDKNKNRRNINGDGRNGAEPDAGAFEYVP